ncbi:xanthine dehydrogenase family protein molybdopterin-binding subunit [Acuticoccus kandeliae]|uniref:xanthine dehydrogenase family protein molybdopterin-binding subunit n=1 Tax=Acuticoccus kandeliae TaxID=2073160 RepID=UPI000D3E8640|nr:molybdopterin cofactor-binding domain-containing protein [Acuticoccus kandeliae]
MSSIGIGQSPKRKEDLRFLTGKGTYVSDIKLPNMAAAVFVRSPHAHAKILSIDSSAAMAAPGMVAVYTGEEMEAAGVNGLPVGWGITGSDGEPMKEPPHPPLAVRKVRHVGDPVAIVIAETLEEARNASELVEVEYEMLEPVVSMIGALKPGAPLVHDDVPNNLCCDWSMGDAAAVDKARAEAAHIARIELVNNRLIGNPMESRAAIAEYEPSRDKYTLYTTSQFPHVVRFLMGGLVLGIPQQKLRVVAPDVGGGFGVKQFHYNEEAVVTWAAGRLARPVKWVSERSEGFVSDRQGRDHVTEAELALDENGKFLGLWVKTLANMGGYLSTFGPNIPTNLYAPLLSGVYTMPAIFCQVQVMFTNTVPVDAYRGAGRPEATFVLERLVDVAAIEMGIDKVEIRKRNMIPKEAYPYQTPVVVEYDSGDPMGCLEKAIGLADIANFEARRKEAAQRGKYRGLGLSTYVEACGLAPSRLAGQMGARGGLYESATVRVHPTGQVTILIGTHNHGQGHETTYAQIISEQLGVPFEDIDVVFGDTDRVQFGMGTYGSRSLVVGGAALSKAGDKVIMKGKKIAAHLLEAGEHDIVFEEGSFKVAGTDRAKSFSEIAGAAYVPHNYPLEVLEPGLEEQAYYDPINFTYPGGSHFCEVEIDPDTGIVELVAYTAVDDVGTIINPMIVEGQLHGGIVQGIGQALYEHGIYDEESGQLLSGSFMDYAMPRADHLPNLVISPHVTPCAHTPMGVKGCGECGTIGSPAAVINAVVDALKPLGITHVDMPASPARIWNIVKNARAATPVAAE